MFKIQSFLYNVDKPNPGNIIYLLEEPETILSGGNSLVFAEVYCGDNIHPKAGNVLVEIAYHFKYGGELYCFPRERKQYYVPLKNGHILYKVLKSEDKLYIHLYGYTLL
jgi:hypothetical protein